MLYNEEEASTAGILNDNVEDIAHEMSYDKVHFLNIFANSQKLHYWPFTSVCLFVCHFDLNFMKRFLRSI